MIPFVAVRRAGWTASVTCHPAGNRLVRDFLPVATARIGTGPSRSHLSWWSVRIALPKLIDRRGVVECGAGVEL
jgi:hypothetical protein